MWKILKRTLMMFVMCLCMYSVAAPVMTAHAESIQQEEQIVADAVTADGADSEESAFLLILMGGALLIILFAVISAMATVSGAISIAVNMDVDGE
ncbi:MAG: hypothetical protein HFG71_16025 [Hungatella sp.]|jgi:hypothetical protein|nr:hypothetical protein [Hungatella sp.]